MSNDKKWWWLAINGGSVAACPIPASEVICTPKPHIYLGFPTENLQLKTQKFLLSAPIEKVNRFMCGECRRNIDSGVWIGIQNDEHDEPTRGATSWGFKGGA